MTDLLQDITEIWATWQARRFLKIKTQSYDDLPEEVREGFESGDSTKIKEAFRWTMKAGHGISNEVREHINDIIQSTKKD